MQFPKRLRFQSNKSDQIIDWTNLSSGRLETILVLFYCSMAKIFVNYTFQYFSPKLSFPNQIRELSSSYIKSHLVICWFDQFPTNTCLRNVVVRLAIIKRSSIDDLQVLVHSKRCHSSKNTKKLSCICRKIRIFLSWGIKRHIANKIILEALCLKALLNYMRYMRYNIIDGGWAFRRCKKMH